MNDEVEITLEEFLKLPKGSYILIDIRSEVSYQLGHIEGAILTHEDIRLEGDRKLIFYCQYGIQSVETAEQFRKCGFRAYSLKGGYTAWLKKRYECRKRGVKSLKVVYSEEKPTRPLEDMSISCRTHCICPPGTKHKCTERRDIPGSVAFVPSIAGLLIAGEVVKDLTTMRIVKNKRNE